MLESLDQKMWQGIVGDSEGDQQNLFGRKFLIFLQFSTYGQSVFCAMLHRWHSDVKFIMLIRNANNHFSRNFHVHCPKSLGIDGTPAGSAESEWIILLRTILTAGRHWDSSTLLAQTLSLFMLHWSAHDPAQSAEMEGSRAGLVVSWCVPWSSLHVLVAQTLAKSPKPASLHANRHAPLKAPLVTAHPWKPHQSQNPPSF